MAKNIFTVFKNITMIVCNIGEYENNFKSRNPVIRRADDIVRLVNRTYPRISCTNIGDFKNIDAHKEVYDRLLDRIDTMRAHMANDIRSADLYLSKIKTLPKYVSEYKLGNCDESAKLALIAAKTNNITDCELRHLFAVASSTGNDLDHLVLYVRNGKKPYIIDPWLGVADFVPEAIQRYKNEFKYHFELSDSPGERIVAEPYTSFFALLLWKVPSKKLKENFKELILPQPYRANFGLKLSKRFKSVQLWLKNKLNI